MKNANEVDDQKLLKTLKTLVWILSVLVVLAAIAAWSFWAKGQKYENETGRLTLDLADLDSSKLALEDTLAALEGSYGEKISENEKLTITLQDRIKEVEALQERIRKVRAQLSKSEETNAQINQRLVMLESLKDSLENDIADLQGQNLELRSANNEIATELTMTREEVAGLSEDLKILDRKHEALVSRLFELAPAGFVAENFKVTAMRRNEKVTAKAGRASEVKVTFDIKNVPEQYQTTEELYLVITKFDGNPVHTIPSKTVSVKSSVPIEIAAADIEQLTLRELQSVEMSFNPDKKFEAGLYNALVYADHGFLGATSFELR